MSKRRVYVHLDEIVYRGLKRLGVHSGECPGMLIERLCADLVAHHQLTDDNFYRWLEAEQRDITYGSPREQLPPPRLRRNSINPDRDDDEWPRFPQD